MAHNHFWVDGMNLAHQNCNCDDKNCLEWQVDEKEMGVLVVEDRRVDKHNAEKFSKADSLDKLSSCFSSMDLYRSAR